MLSSPFSISFQIELQQLKNTIGDELGDATISSQRQALTQFRDKLGKVIHEGAEEAGDAVIAVTMARETPYEFYVSAMAGIKQAYAKVKNEYSQAVYNKDYEQLSTPQKKKVLEAIPEKITETTD